MAETLLIVALVAVLMLAAIAAIVAAGFGVAGAYLDRDNRYGGYDPFPTDDDQGGESPLPARLERTRVLPGPTGGRHRLDARDSRLRTAPYVWRGAHERMADDPGQSPVTSYVAASGRGAAW